MGNLGRSLSINTNTLIPKTDLYVKPDLQLNEVGPPKASRGILGISLAHDALLEIGRVGLLIGGIAKENYFGNNNLDNFNSHKDVDVMVLHRKGLYTSQEEDPEKFYNGIDWWCYEKFSNDGKRAGYINGNNVALRFSAILKRDHRPGLYIPGITLLNSINEIEYQEKFTDTHPSMYFPFINIPRLLKRDVQITPIQET